MLMDTKFIAKLVLETIRIHESSYDHEAADAATVLGAAKAACRAACVAEMEQPIYLLCQCAWNDIQSWAAGIMAKD